MNKKEVKMYMENKEFEKFCKEADACKLSHSNYLKVNFIKGKHEISRGKELTSKQISEEIERLKTRAWWQKHPMPPEDLNFLLKLKENKK